MTPTANYYSYGFGTMNKVDVTNASYLYVNMQQSGGSVVTRTVDVRSLTGSWYIGIVTWHSQSEQWVGIFVCNSKGSPWDTAQKSWYMSVSAGAQFYISKIWLA